MSKYPNSGILFVNKGKKEGDSRPKYTGQCEVGGKKYDMAMWVKEGEKGKFYTVNFKEPQQRHAGDSDTEPRGRRNAAADEDF